MVKVTAVDKQWTVLQGNPSKVFCQTKPWYVHMTGQQLNPLPRFFETLGMLKQQSQGAVAAHPPSIGRTQTLRTTHLSGSLGGR